MAIGGVASVRSAEGSAFQVLDPIDGAVVHRRLGRPVPEGLEIDIRGVAPVGAQVWFRKTGNSRSASGFCGVASAPPHPARNHDPRELSRRVAARRRSPPIG